MHGRMRNVYEVFVRNPERKDYLEVIGR